jgi:Ca-activated chloride channel family protein
LLALAFHAGAARGAGLLVADGGLGGNLEIVEQNVQVTINNGIAVTEVTQVFRNTENRQVEALYTFPVPRQASVANFSMWIGGKEMVGEVLEKKRAREIYDSYKRVRRDPGLLEQVDYKTFEMRIFPIGPRAEQKVQICYYQELDYDLDWATYVYPLATTTKGVVSSATTGRFAFSMRMKSAVPIVAVQSPSHADSLVVAQHDEVHAEASIETKAGDLNRDVVVAYQVSRPRTGIDLVASKQPNEDGYLYLALTAGEELAGERAGMDYVFILDISGSMADDGKLGISRDSVAAFIEALGTDDRFEVVTFNVTPTALFSTLVPANEDNQSKAASFLASQAARGGTVLKPALAMAYQYADADRALNVVVVSDGMTEQAERTALLEMGRAKPARARVFCVGVGNDVNRPLLEQIAEDAGGLAAFVSRGDDFARQAQAFRRKLTRPAATDLAIGFEGLEVREIEPPRLPNLYHGAPVRLYARYRSGGPVKVRVQATVDGVPLEQLLDLSLPDVDAGNPEIERMWAWHRVDRLLKEADRVGSRDQALNEVVRLGEEYSIATEYTSFIVLENDGEYKRWKIERRNALRLQQDRQAQEAALVQLDALRNQAAARVKADVTAPELATPSAHTNPAGASQQIAANNPPPTRSQPGDLNFTPGGGPIGPLGLAGVGVLAVVEWRRRRAGQCSR